MKSLHIPYNKLADFVAGLETTDEATRIRTHLSVCPECALILARLESGEPDQNSSNRIIAELSFDSRQMSPAFGVRSGRSVARQLLFSIGENDLDLRVAPDDGAWIVTGQFLGDCNRGEVELRGDNVTERVTMNELCEFQLPRVPPGSYSLVVYISQMEIEIPKFELRP